MKVILRGDGNGLIGYGHIVRLLAFAQAICNKYETILITSSLENQFTEEYEKIIKSIIYLPGNLQLAQEASWLGNYIHPGDLVVLDGYTYTTEYQKVLKDQGAFILKISDYSEPTDHLDAILNHSGGIELTSYPKSLHANFYIGPAYCLVRREFVSNCKYTKGGHILICLGGTDQSATLKKVLRAVLEADKNRPIKVISKFKADIEHERISYLFDLSASQMAKLISQSALVISTASSISYETSSVKCPIVIGTIAENQRNLYAFLCEKGLAKGVGDLRQSSVKEICEGIKSVLNTETGKIQMNNQQDYFDGQSALRLVNVVEKFDLMNEISIREAKKDDLHLLFSWVTDSVVRQNAINKGEVTLEGHSEWFEKSLQNTNREIYILSYKNKVCAQVRFDSEGQVATISYSIESSHRGLGLGEPLLRVAIPYYLKRNRSVSQFRAIVQVTNVPSNKIFQNMNFTLNEQTIIEGQEFNVYLK